MRKVRKAIDQGNVEHSFCGSTIKPVFRTFNYCMQGRCGALHADAPKLECCVKKDGK
jgi:hypothetical protein